MPFAETVSGFPAVVFVAGIVVSLVGVWMLATKRPSEVASKWLAGGIGIAALGIILGQIF